MCTDTGDGLRQVFWFPATSLVILQNGFIVPSTGVWSTRKDIIFPQPPYTVMRRLVAMVCLFICLSYICTPVAATEMNRYSYLTVERMVISLEGDQATVTLDYTIDEAVELLVLFLGKSDLQDKVTDILNFENPRFRELSLDRSVMVVDHVALDYQDGTYWFPAHQFDVVVPHLIVRTPQAIREFENVSHFPDGIGYFES